MDDVDPDSESVGHFDSLHTKPFFGSPRFTKCDFLFEFFGFFSREARHASSLSAVRNKEPLAIAAKWNFPHAPTFHVMDHKGVIRYKWVGRAGHKVIDAALEKRIKEVEVSGKNTPK